MCSGIVSCECLQLCGTSAKATSWPDQNQGKINQRSMKNKSGRENKRVCGPWWGMRAACAITILRVSRQLQTLWAIQTLYWRTGDVKVFASLHSPLFPLSQFGCFHLCRNKLSCTKLDQFISQESLQASIHNFLYWVFKTKTHQINFKHLQKTQKTFASH